MTRSTTEDQWDDALGTSWRREVRRPDFLQMATDGRAVGLAVIAVVVLALVVGAVRS